MLENRRIGRLAALALALAAATPAPASDWRLTAARHTRYGSSLSFVDLQSIRGGDGQVQFSTLTFFGRRTRGMNRVAAAVTAECRSMTYRFDRVTLLWNQRPLGTWHSLSSQSARPHSNVYDAIGAACGLSDAGAHVERIESFAAAWFQRQRRARA